MTRSRLCVLVLCTVVLSTLACAGDGQAPATAPTAADQAPPTTPVFESGFEAGTEDWNQTEPDRPQQQQESQESQEPQGGTQDPS